MSRWRAFVEVLDEILTDQEPVAATEASPAYRPSVRMASTPLYAFAPHQTPNNFWTTPGPYRPSQTPSQPADRAHGVEGRATQQRHADPERRLAGRPLKPAEESALQTLVRLGAALDGRFTARELRSTFRTLAQRYHPDRHPHASDAERMRLGAMFAELTHAYGVLHDAAH